MKNALLAIAVLLALLINGLLLHDNLAISDQIAQKPDVVVVEPEPEPVREPEKVVEPEEELVSSFCFIAKKESVTSDGCNSGCYCDNGSYQDCQGAYYHNGSRWQYHRGQPARNVVRFFHNRRPLRRAIAAPFRWLFGRRCW
jgi:hypothetical protein